MSILTDYFKYRISQEQMNVSHEYQAFDWPRFFLLGWNQLYRYLNRDSVLMRIDGITAYIKYLTGSPTTIGNFWHLFQELSITLSGNLLVGIPAVIREINLHKVNGNKQDIIESVPNIYHILYNATSSIQWTEPEYYRGILDVNKEMIAKLNKQTQRTQWRTAYTGELNMLKLFRPNEIAKDINNFTSKYRAVKSRLTADQINQWDSIVSDANALAKSISDFILSNVKDGGGFIKR